MRSNYYPSTRYSYSDNEIVPGLAVFLEPSVLLDHTGFEGWVEPETRTVRREFSPLFAAGKRYFVVVERRDGLVALAPMYSQPKPYRTEVTDKGGHPSWTDHPTHIDRRQVWVVSAEGAIAAAERAGDLSRPECRNRVLPASLREIQAAIGALFNRPTDPTKEKTDETQRAA